MKKYKIFRAFIFILLLTVSFGFNSVEATIFFFPEIHIVDGVSGAMGDCASIGTWDASTKTCTLTVDVSNPIYIDTDGVTLDGAGHNVSANIFITNRTGVTIKHTTLVSRTVYVNTSPNTTITENSFSGSSPAIYLFTTSDVNIIHNNFYVAFSTDTIQSFDAGGTVVASQPLPTGGNYYDPNVCTDANNDTVCDGPFLIHTDGGDDIIDNFPWLTPSGWQNYIPPPPGDSNVLFLPGLEASRLYKPKTVLGVPVEDQLWEPNWDSDAQDLYLDSTGVSINPNIYTRDIVKETNIPFSTGSLGQNIYKSFSDMMDGLVSNGKIAQWKSFAYDWRESVSDVVNSPQKYADGQVLSLVDTLQGLVDSSKNQKVTIVAHSNGGLVAKMLLKKLKDDKVAGTNDLIDHIDVLILVASPQLGTPTAIPALLHGYDQDLGFGILLHTSTARELGRNMPGGYGLLPSAEYFNHISTPVVQFVPNILNTYMSNDISLYSQNITNYSTLKNFLTGSDGRANPPILDTRKPVVLSSSLLATAQDLHTAIDTMTLPPSIRVIQIAGWGLDTVAGFEYSANTPCQTPTDNGCAAGYSLDERPIFTADGDKTVVTPSALAMSGEKWWVNMPLSNKGILNFDRQHKDILEVSSINDLISNTIQNAVQNSYTYLSTTTPVDTSNRIRLSVHSPVTLDAYDASGNHTGKFCPISPDTDLCYAEEIIPNSGYYEFGEGKYLNVPQDAIQKAVLQGTDVGTFTFESQVITPSGSSTISSFVNIPVTTQTQAEITVNPTTQVPQLKLDVTGDGIPDFTLAPSSVFDPITYLQVMKATIDSLDLSQNKKDAFDKRVDNIIKLIQKGKIDKAKLKAEKFKSVLEKKLTKPDSKKPKPKKLSKTDAQMLLDLLNGLLDNLN